MPSIHYAGLDFRGFRCDAAYQVPAAFWRDIIGAVKARFPGVLFFAETLGCTPERALETAGAGFDFIFNSSKWWNFREPWCLEQYALTAPVIPSISFPESHDTLRLAAELDGDRDAVLQRYAFAATFSTGVMMPIGFEYGFRKRLHVVKTTPEDCETPAWDLTGAITAINRMKAAHRPLNEEGPLHPVDLGDPRLFGFREWTRDGREWVLVVLNLDRTAGSRVPVPPHLATDPGLSWTDLVSAASGLLSDLAPLELAPSGILILHPLSGGDAPPAGAEGADTG